MIAYINQGWDNEH